MRGAGLTLGEAKAKTEAIKARVAAAAPAPAPQPAPKPVEVRGETDYSGGSDYDSSYPEPAYEAPVPEPEPAYEAPAPASAPAPNNGGGKWVESWEPNGTDDCWQGDTSGNAWRCP